MRIDKRMNLVIPLEREGQPPLWVHSTPIMTETFDAYYLPLSITFDRLFKDNIVTTVGPRVALLMLRDVARERGMLDDSADGQVVGVERGLIGEMRRLTNVVLFDSEQNSWAHIPLENAYQRELISGDERTEVEGQLAFFTLVSHVVPRQGRPGLMGGLTYLWGAQGTFLSCTEYVGSLKTPIAPATTRKRPATSSVPR